MRRARHRLAVILATAALTIAVAAGCAPEPAPTPTPTGFASEEEAFAAAEATYRAYVDALNQVDLSDPATFEPVYEWLTGDASDAARKSFSQMHADSWTVNGISRITLVDPVTISSDMQSATLAVCVDVSNVSVLDSNGDSLVTDRPDNQRLTVHLVESKNEHFWLISRFSSRAGAPEC